MNNQHFLVAPSPAQVSDLVGVSYQIPIRSLPYLVFSGFQELHLLSHWTTEEAWA